MRHTACEGMIDCIGCNHHSRAIAVQPVCGVSIGPRLFCIYCEMRFYSPDKQAEEVKRLIMGVLEVQEAVKELLPQPIWEEVLEHLQ